jgi:ribosomal protein S18 acetylase RimI-like enzyme
MSSGITVRAATPDDAGDIERIRVAGWRVAYAGLVPRAYLDAMRLDDEAILLRRRRMTTGPADVRSLVSEGADGTAGFVVYGPDRAEHSAGRPAGEVYALYVDPGAWSRGHGHALLDGAVRALAGDGYRLAGLWVLAGNAHARAFYERFGMAATGEEHLYHVGGVGVPELRYEMSLPVSPA